MSRPRIMSLCSGYGGLDMAAEAVTGGTTVAFAEYDDDPSKILAHHWPDVPNLRDVKAIDWQAWVGKVDIITAGYPCQPFSHAGKRAGENDPRHLWPAIIAGIRVLRPRLVLLENVRGHLSLGFDAVLGDLAEAGFDAEWCLLRASDVGAPHGRARLFIAATDAEHGRRETVPHDGPPSGTGGCVEGGQPEPGRSAPASSYGGRVTSAAADACSERHGQGVHAGGVGRVDGQDAGQARQRERAREVTGDRGGEVAADECDHCGHWYAGKCCHECYEKGPTPADASSDGRHEGWPEPAGQLGRPHAAQCGDALTDTDEPGSQGREPAAGRDMPAWGAYEPAIRRWERVTARPAPRPTDPGRNGRERLSPRFVEFMMGLPEGHVTDVPDLSRNAQLKALGNGVVPQQAAAAYRMLLAHIATEAAA